ncbi:MAG: T9SS type A sorting domain-containing protein [Bacteroidetes bacterium]|nr:T9SS type A sorting domain-containing protein [Bacteroidota bacterium]
MKRTILSFLTMTIVSFCFSSVKAQFNLVPNPSFEVFDTCPFGGDQVRFAIPWIDPLYPSTPDYMNACDSAPSPVGVPDNSFGFEYANTGNGYALIITYATNQTNPLHNHWREYVETELSDTLIAGVDYCIRFYVSSVDSVKYVSNDLGIFFSNVKIQDTCPGQLPCNLSYIPQFENSSNNNLNSDNGWTLVSGNYIAIGGEKFIVIGNFKDSASTVATYKGYGQWNYASYYVDDILISPCDSLTEVNEVDSNHDEFIVFPNPSNGTYILKTNKLYIEHINIFDATGRLVTDIYRRTNEAIFIDLEKHPTGIYVLEIFTNSKLIKLKLIKY